MCCVNLWQAGSGLLRTGRSCGCTLAGGWLLLVKAGFGLLVVRAASRCQGPRSSTWLGQKATAREPPACPTAAQFAGSAFTPTQLTPLSSVDVWFE